MLSTKSNAENPKEEQKRSEREISAQLKEVKLVIKTQPQKIQMSNNAGNDDDNEEIVHAPNNGCLILRGPTRDETYVTRYLVNHDEQVKGLCQNVCLDECYPCCLRFYEEYQPILVPPRPRRFCSDLRGFIWGFIRSEAFIFFLHIFAIGLGVSKAAFSLRNEHPKAELIHSIVETFATLTLICVRMGNSYNDYDDIESALRGIDYIDFKAFSGTGDVEVNPHVKTVRFWLYLMFAGGGSLALICGGSFFLFNYFNVLEWTVLSNTFCMIVIGTMYTLFYLRIDLALNGIKQDQLRVALLEAALIISELLSSKAQKSMPGAKRFIRALKNTEFYRAPKHIELCTPEVYAELIKQF